MRFTSTISAKAKPKHIIRFKELVLIFPTKLNVFTYLEKLGLLKCGDFESNPGPLVNFKSLTKIFHENGNRMKFFHINAQSLLKKRSTLKGLIQDLGPNNITGVSETWLKNTDDNKLWKISPNIFKTFRLDRQSPEKDRGGGVILVVPTKLNLKLREDLNHLNKTFFESIWIERKMTTNST